MVKEESVDLDVYCNRVKNPMKLKRLIILYEHLLNVVNLYTDDIAEQFGKDGMKMNLKHHFKAIWKELEAKKLFKIDWTSVGDDNFCFASDMIDRLKYLIDKIYKIDGGVGLFVVDPRFSHGDKVWDSESRKAYELDCYYEITKIGESDSCENWYEGWLLCKTGRPIKTKRYKLYEKNLYRHKADMEEALREEKE